ncbi:hypothetical protein GJW-30_1_02420 [Variibacter gotjawalensis]|uniref:Right handed beta helix domain-containing protein n=1 Tax=Variibacter gotjawalensis TaxID=1333996 RepID=A0A0S3PVE3_9BRAD|nr:right-handed parallel beta-helix repeat-containing protein [Variibacter gotjawalensis]NIK45707.1 hypothetical protein [Variibacter gotjawalensis]RZS47633.1 parallel beta helix pectate lyase-like protein [Variibacter gotjawalensis]BAT59885.1 hypothetical protein GJW-30_1_02420 [Variibacter gotjawalensis]
MRRLTLAFATTLVASSALAQPMPNYAVPPTSVTQPAISRGGLYMGFAERFNRYYTDASWKPSRIIYVAPDARGDGATREAPTTPQAAIAAATPGTQITFLPGRYDGCFEFDRDKSGTYDAPIVLYGERNQDRSLAAIINCCGSGRQTCFNFEGASHIAVDGFAFVGGKYGVRTVGNDYAASQHASGIAVVNCIGHDQTHDPFFSGASSWAVWERLLAYGAKSGDGHGIYLSNGSDWNIVRFNETYSNDSSDFQINADPASTCKDVGIAFNDPRCDAYAGTGEGGQGASDYFLVDGNYFHHSNVGPNFTSVRRSIVRNNIFGPQVRHNVSFWQETDNPKLSSSDNVIVHNLFITNGRHGVQFVNQASRNLFANNVIIGMREAGNAVASNPSAVLMEADKSSTGNVFRNNLYVSGKVEGRTPNTLEWAIAEFSPAWFVRFPVGLGRNPNDFTPAAGAPFLNVGPVLFEAQTDRNGTPRAISGDLGPIEIR